MVWSGSRPACLPLPFICLPVLFICLPFFLFVSQAGCLWSGSRLACLPLPFILGACGRGLGRLVSHFLECVSHFFSIDSQAGCLWSGSRLACRPLPCFCFPFPFICLPLLFICLPGWVLVVGFPGGLSPTSLHLSPTFSPKQFTVGVSQFFLKTCPPFVSLLVSAHFHWPCNISIHPSPRCVTAGVRPFPLAMQHFYSCVSQVCHWWCPPFSAGRVAFLFICLPGLSLLAMQHFYSFVPQVCHLRCPPFSAGDATFLFTCFPGLSLLMSHFCSFVSQACHWWCPPFSAGQVAGRLVSHFLSFVSQFFSFVSQFFSFVSQAGCLRSGSRLACLPLPFILGACGRGLGRLVSHFLECVSHFFSIDSQAGCLWSGSRLACRPLPCFCFPFPFICLPLLFICLPGWVLVVGFPGGLSPTSLHLSPTFSPKQFTVGVSQFFLKTCPPFVSLLVSAHFHWPCNISIHPSPRCVTAGVRPFPLAMQHFYSCVSQVCHWWCPPFSAGRVAFLFICLPGLSLLAMQHFYSFVPQVCHLRCPPFSAGDATFLFTCFPGLSLLMSHFCSFVSQACHWWCPPFSAGHVAFLFICLPHLSLLVSAPFRWPCSISIHLFVTAVSLSALQSFTLVSQLWTSQALVSILKNTNCLGSTVV